MSKTGLFQHVRPYEGATNVWLTPRYIIDALGPFDLDPCAATDRPWDCASKNYTVEDDGLMLPWSGIVWCNPPYGPHARKWLCRLVEHGNGIALMFARTETRMFFESVWPAATGILFLRGRIRFCRPCGTPAANGGAPSVLIAYGNKCASRLRQCELEGFYIDLRRTPTPEKALTPKREMPIMRMP